MRMRKNFKKHRSLILANRCNPVSTGRTDTEVDAFGGTYMDIMRCDYQHKGIIISGNIVPISSFLCVRSMNMIKHYFYGVPALARLHWQNEPSK